MTESTIDRLDQDYPEEKIDLIYKTEREKIEKLLNEVKSSENYQILPIKSRWDDIKQLIFHVDSRVNYWESRRTQYLNYSAGILVSSIAAIISIVSTILNNKNQILSIILLFPILVPSIVLLISSIIIIMLWNSQNNPSYPFTKGYRTWRWQYRHAEKTPSDTDVLNYTRETFNKQVEIFIDNLFNYRERMIKADIYELFEQDLAQLFLLLTNEKFKIKFVGKLRDSLISSLSIGLFVFIIAIIISVISLLIISI